VIARRLLDTSPSPSFGSEINTPGKIAAAGALAKPMIAWAAVVVAAYLAVASTAARGAPADKSWVGKRVVPRSRGFTLRDADQVARHRLTALLIDRVGLVVGPRLWLIAENEMTK
jgi:hypothetical protein